MAKEIGRYDTSLQMFVDKPHNVDLNHLRFLRKLAERGKFGPRPLSRPRGDYALMQTDAEIARQVRMEEEAKRPAFGHTKAEALLAHIAQFGDY